MNALPRADGWAALSGLYLSDARFPQAFFCLEEGLLHRPEDAVALVRCADVAYSIGGADAFRAALGMYATAVRLTQGTLPRAIFGMLAAAARAAASRGAEKGDEFGPTAKVAMEAAATALRALFPEGSAEACAVRATIRATGVE